MLHRSCLGDAGSRHRLAFRPASIPGREQFGLSPGQTLQMIALPWRIELVPTQSPAALRGFLLGKKTFQREADRL